MKGRAGWVITTPCLSFRPRLSQLCFWLLAPWIPQFEIYLLKHCVYHTLLGCFHFDLMNRAVDSNAHGAANSVAVSAPFRLPGSPYPAPGQGPNSTRTVVVFNDTLLTSTQLLTVQTLQVS